MTGRPHHPSCPEPRPPQIPARYADLHTAASTVRIDGMHRPWHYTVDDLTALPADYGYMVAAHPHTIKQILAELGAAEAERDHLAAILDHIRTMHRPVSFSWTGGTLTTHEVCDTCHDQPGVHPCGCWRDEPEQHYYCDGCSTPGRTRPWPCATRQALDGGGGSA